MGLEEGTVRTREGAGRVFAKVRLTSVREELSVDLLEGLFIDHTTGALLGEGRESGDTSGVCTRERSRTHPWGPGSSAPWWAALDMPPCICVSKAVSGT